jgi:hypothetical protein
MSKSLETKLMRTFIVLICSMALASVAPGAEEGKKKEQKKGPQAGQVSKPTGGKPAAMGKPTGVGRPTQIKQHKENPTQAGKPMEVGKPKGFKQHKDKPTQAGNAAKAGKAKGAGKLKETAAPAKAGKRGGAGKAGAVGVAAGKPLKPQHFKVPKQPNTAKAPPVKFQQGRHIEGSQNWQGQNYAVFRNYKSEWHDQGWWHNHHNNIVFVFGAPYYWNSGYWFPAWGYAPNAYYAWDGPIYGYNNLPPDQVIANVQSTLQQQGYYQGEVDGLLGPQTRAAIADYQRANGLAETAAIDQPTLQSLGMA